MPRRKLAGRPPGPKSLLRRRRVVLLLTDEEYRRLRAVTTSAMTIGARARELVLAALGEEENR